jgi:O-antigen/teichoic acid export membrane protein
MNVHARGREASGLIGILRRLGWGVGDQAVSSASNFVLGVVVARALGPEGFGAFSLAYLTYAFVLNAMRGVATDPLVVRFSAAPTDLWRRAVAASTATAAGIGLLAGVVCVLVGLALPATLSGGFVALGIALPALMLQDSWRFAFFAAGRPAQAFLNDLVWTVLLIGALLVLAVTDRAGVVSCVLTFGGTAALAAAFGFLQCRIRPRPSWVRAWVSDHRALGGRYLIENVSIGGARQLRFFALGALAGLAAVGNVRAAEILMGPFLVLLMGVSQVAVPEAAQVVARAPRRLLLFCFALGGVQAVTAAAWLLLVLVAVPDALGSGVLGPIWYPAVALLPIVGLGMSIGGLEIGAAAGVRALGAAPRSLVAQLVNASLYVTLGITGAWLGGARGSCWGVVIATALGTVVWWVQLHRALDEHLDGLGRDAVPDLRPEGIST